MEVSKELLRITRQFVLLLFITILVHVSHGQSKLTDFDFHGDYKYFFELNDSITAVIYNNTHSLEPQKSWFKNKVDSLPMNDNLLTKVLKSGNYLMAWVDEEQVKYKIKQQVPFDIYELSTGRKTQLRITSKAGRLIDDVSVQFHKKKLKRNSDGNFEINRTDNLKRLFTIKHKNQTYYWTIDQSSFQNDEISTPLFIRRAGHLATQIHYRNPLRRVIIKSRLKKRPLNQRGYIAINQPKFRIGDTLKWKAYVLTKRGKPYKKQLDLALVKSYSKISTTSVLPIKPGVFCGSLIIADTLTIDSRYSLKLIHQKSLEELRHSFRVEDYELPEHTFEASLSSIVYYGNDTISLKLNGKDANGLAASGSRCHIVCHPSEAHNFESRFTHVPISILDTTVFLDDRGELDFKLPSNTFPKCDFKLNVVVDFTSLSNELKTQSCSAQYTHTPKLIAYKSVGDSIVIEWRNPAYTSTSRIQLDDKTIQLPYTFTFDQFTSHATVTFSDQEQLNIPNKNKVVQASYDYVGDSLFLSLYNPLQYEVLVSVLRDRKIIHQRYSKEHLDTIIVDSKHNYQISYSYPFDGEVISQIAQTPHLPTQTIVSIDMPERIYPGQSVDAKVHVTNYKGEPISGVDITLAAYTSKFKSGIHSSVPTPQVKNRKTAYHTTWERQELHNRVRTDDYWKDMHQTLTSDHTNLIYKILNTDSINTFHFETQGQWTSVRPIVVSNGKIIEPHLIYFNKQLVHISASKTPNLAPIYYSDSITISVRVHDFLITLPKLKIKKGSENIISFNMDNLPQGTVTKPRPTHFTSSETRTIKEHTFFYKSTSYSSKDIYFKQNTRSLSIDRRNSYYNRRNQLIGPFSPHIPVTFIKPHMLSKSFSFKQQTAYSFTPEGIDRFPVDHDNTFNNYLRLYASPEQILFSQTISPHQLQEFLKPQIKTTFFRPLFNTTTAQNGELRLVFSDDSKKANEIGYIICFPTEAPDKFQIISKYKHTFNNLSPGEYTYFFVTKEGKVSQTQRAIVRPQHILHSVIYQEELKWQPMDELTRSLFDSRDMDELTRLFGNDINKYSKSQPNPFRQIEIQRTRIVILDSATHQPLVGVAIKSPNTSKKYTDLYGAVELKSVNDSLSLSIMTSGWVTISKVIDMGQELILFMRKKDAIDSSDYMHIDITYHTVINKFSEHSITREVMCSEMVSSKGSSVAVLAKRKSSYKFSLRQKGRPTSATPGRNSTITGLAYNEAEGFISFDSIANIQAGNVSIPLTEVDAPQVPQSIRDNFKDCAIWEPLLTTDKNGVAQCSVTFPEDITGWKVIALAMDENNHYGSDEKVIQAYKPVQAKLYTPRFLIEGDRAENLGIAQNNLNDSVSIITKFVIGEDSSISSGWLKKANRYYLPDFQPTSGDSLNIQFEVQSEDFSDGEKRSIPVYKRGLLERHGSILHLIGDTSHAWIPNFENGPIKIAAYQNDIQFLLSEIEHLENYPYGCNEQKASKLQAFLLEKRIKSHLGENFEHDREVKKLIKGLKKSQLDDGGWGWWSSTNYNTTMTLFVFDALANADSAGYKVPNLHATANKLQNDLSYSNLVSLCHSLLTLQKHGYAIDIGYWIQMLEKEIKHYQLPITSYEATATLLLKQRAGIRVDLTALLAASSKTALGNIYWTRNTASTFYRPFHQTFLCHQLFSENGNHAKEVNLINGYFLESKNHLGWSNTHESLLALDALLPSYLDRSVALTNKLFIGGQKVEKFPYKSTISSSSTINFKKEGPSELFVSAYQEQWNPQPAVDDSLFVLSNKLLNKQGQEVKRLETGESATLKVMLRVRASSDYLMLEVPIPAGCSYLNTKKETRFIESHREHFKNKTNIYCEHLEPGNYTFEINLSPKYPGEYTLNPVQISSMYIPLLDGNTAIKTVKIEKN